MHGPPLVDSGKNVAASFLPFTSLNPLFLNNSRPLLVLLEVAFANFLLALHPYNVGAFSSKVVIFITPIAS